jgi:fatty-acyl-CoA synthase
MRARLGQRAAELRLLPRLLARVVPELALARFLGTESLVHVVYRQAQQRAAATALVCGESRLDYAGLVQGFERWAALLEAQGVGPGTVVGLIGRNSIDYVLAILACARLGAPLALLSPELDGSLLERALEKAGCHLVLTDAAAYDRARAATRHPVSSYDAPAFQSQLERGPERPALALPAGGDADFVYVFTSGTTGESKACRLNHRRALLASTAFSRLVHQLRPDDILYCPLPLHHSSALLLGLGATLVAGSQLVLRDRFSASALLPDLRRYGCTILLYIGELGRAWLEQPESSLDRQHRLRLALGNGLSAPVWARLQQRFAIPRIAEFYAASEFPGAIVNLSGEVGSVGHVPLERLRGYRLVVVDTETGEIARDSRGRALPCEADQPGELVLRLKPLAKRPTGDYLGYVGERAGNERIARELFRTGDVYCRSGDLLRRNRAGAYFFVDRLGDTFRFKGENVSTREVESALAATPSVRALAVVGVALPGVDGKLGLLIVDAPDGISLEALAERARLLPGYARPAFVRVASALPVTASLKVKKAAYAQEGVDPARVSDPIFYRQGDRYLPLGVDDYRRIADGQTRF